MSTEKLIEVTTKPSDHEFCIQVQLSELIESVKVKHSGTTIGDTNYGKLNGPQIFISSAGQYLGMMEYQDGIEDGNAVTVGPSNAIIAEGRFENGECIFVKMYRDGFIYSWEKNPENGFSYKIEDPQVRCSIQFNVDKDGYGCGESLAMIQGEQKTVTLRKGTVMRESRPWSYWLVVVGIIVFGLIAGAILWKKYWFCVCSTYKHRFVHVLHKPPYPHLQQWYFGCQQLGIKQILAYLSLLTSNVT